MKSSAQLVGNVGMYFAAYRLSMLGWNVSLHRGMHAALTYLPMIQSPHAI